MKILYITGSMPPLKCGIGFYSSRLLTKITQGNKITVLTAEGLDEEASEYATRFTHSWKLRDVKKIVSIIDEENPQLISLQYPAKGYGRQLGINVLPYFLRKRKVVLTLHEYHGSPILGKIRNLITAIPVNKIIVSNPYDLKALPWFLRSKTTVIPIGSNIKKYLPNKPVFDKIMSSAGFSTKKPVGVFFGFAFENKGLDLLLEAVSKSGTQLLLLTELDPNNAFHTRLLKKIDTIKQAGGKVYCAGYLKDRLVSQILRECSYFILPQPLPLTAKSGTAIAGARHGLPIISTGADDKSLNLPYIHNDNSILLNPLNLQTLSKTLTELEGSSDELKLLSSGANKLASYFSWDNIAERHKSLWKDVLDEK